MDNSFIASECSIKIFKAMPDSFSYRNSLRFPAAKDEQTSSSIQNVVSPLREMVAYEVLWSRRNQTLKSISALFKRHKALPSALLEKEFDEDIISAWESVKEYLANKSGFSVSVHGAFQYPNKLQQAKYPIELFYYKGDINLLESRCISVVGSRKCSDAGKKRTKKLVSELVKHEVTIVSGLAIGIDTVALTTAIKQKGRVVGVIGTPIDEYYPRENRELQDEIAKEFLLLSQVPFFRYAHQPFQSKRNYFPQRNETMSALSEATIIVEASDTSGSLTQARACLSQGRKLFILDSCFKNPDITWPAHFEKKGAIRISDTDDILRELKLK